MCADLGSDDKRYGVRIFDGVWSDGYLGRVPVRPGYCYVIWKGRHVAEPTELSEEEATGFWEVAAVASAVERRYRPVKMNWLSLGNTVPHLHVHLVPRYHDDPHAGGPPLEQNAFDHDAHPPLDDHIAETEARALRDLLGQR